MASFERSRKSVPKTNDQIEPQQGKAPPPLHPNAPDIALANEAIVNPPSNQVAEDAVRVVSRSAVEQELFRKAVELVGSLTGDERVEAAIVEYFYDPLTHGRQTALLKEFNAKNPTSFDDHLELVFLIMDWMVRDVSKRQGWDVPEQLRDYVEGIGYLAYASGKES